MFWKDCLSKEIALKYDLSCIIRKDDIIFPDNMILFFRHKRKDDFSQKNTWKYVFFNSSQKMIFPKNSHLNKIFFVISEKMVFPFSRKYKFIFRRKMKGDLYRKIHGNMIFPVYIYINVTDTVPPFCRKNKDDLVPKKYT